MNPSVPLHRRIRASVEAWGRAHTRSAIAATLLEGGILRRWYWVIGYPSEEEADGRPWLVCRQVGTEGLADGFDQGGIPVFEFLAAVPRIEGGAPDTQGLAWSADTLEFGAGGLVLWDREVPRDDDDAYDLLVSLSAEVSLALAESPLQAVLSRPPSDGYDAEDAIIARVWRLAMGVSA